MTSEQLSAMMIDYRTDLSLSQEQAAELAGVATLTWANIERMKNRPHAVTARKIERCING